MSPGEFWRKPADSHIHKFFTEGSQIVQHSLPIVWYYHLVRKKARQSLSSLSLFSKMKALRRKPGGLSFYDYPQARGQAPGGMRSQEAPGLRRDAFSPMRESVQRECLGGGPRFAAGHQGRVRRSQGRLPLRNPVFSGHAAFKSAQTVRRAMLSHAFSPISAAAPFAGTEKERRPPPRLISNFIEAMGGGRRFFVPPQRQAL